MVDGERIPPLPTITPNSSFFLGPQDKPGDHITLVRLKLDNFDDWSYAIRVSLTSRRKFRFLNGTINSFVSPCTEEDWRTIHCMLVSWITNTFHPEVLSILSKYDNAKRLWDDLHECFSVVNRPRIHQLKTELTKCEQTKTMAVNVYYSKLGVLWDELDHHDPIISCTCGHCNCNVGQAYEKGRDNDRLQQFLLGLCSEYYGNLRSTLLSQVPLPSLNRTLQ